MKWLTVSQGAKKTGISERTIRRYITEHGQFIKMKREGRITKIAEDNLQILQKIRYYYTELNWDKEQVNEVLSDTQPMNITVNTGESDPNPPLFLGEYLNDLKKVLSIMAERQQQLEKEIKSLRMQQMEREQQFATELEQIKSSLYRIESQSETKKGWFRRLFDKS